jgi:type II secretory pathway predicted ATPase ExeA
MTPTETAGYVGHHVALAGRKDTLFSDDAVARLHEAARGLPRAVNNLARQALVAAYANRSSLVDDKAARQAVAEAESD